MMSIGLKSPNFRILSLEDMFQPKGTILNTTHIEQISRSAFNHRFEFPKESVIASERGNLIMAKKWSPRLHPKLIVEEHSGFARLQ
jgi:hypothetical protein